GSRIRAIKTVIHAGLINSKQPYPDLALGALLGTWRALLRDAPGSAWSFFRVSCRRTSHLATV
ncbi:MAG: hypothetical protein ACRCYZ_02455, partial [Alphaproteobacteria bacterium]